MNFNIGVFLQDEINKKQKEILKSSDIETRTSSETVEDTVEEDQTNEKEDNIMQLEEEEETAVGETNASIQDQMDKLLNRSERIGETLEEEESLDSNIEVNTIMDDNVNTSILSMACNLYIHELLKKWEIQEYDSDLLIETKKNLFPLLVKLRKNRLDPQMLISISTILYHLQQPREINLSLQSYMKLSIGNVAWPIGVTQIGIHQRSAHSKLATNSVANIMIDDRTRLWITSLKRLITFKEWLDKRAQSK